MNQKIPIQRVSPSKVKAHNIPVQRLKPKLKELKLELVDQINAEEFLKKFRDQTSSEFIYCLRLHNMGTPLFLSAHLSRKGKLLNSVKVSSSGLSDLPPCVLETLSSMDFASVTSHFKKEKLQIHWQVRF